MRSRPGSRFARASLYAWGRPAFIGVSTGAMLIVVACNREPVPVAVAGDDGAAGPREWRLVGPTLEIGGDNGESGSSLNDVVAAAVLDDGRVAVLNAGTSELVLYTSEGEFLARTGGPGEAAGKFRRPVGLYLTHPDSLLVYDASLNRESRFDTALRFVWASETAAPEQEPFPRDVWLSGIDLVSGPRDHALRDPVRRVLAELPAPAEPAFFRRVMVDPMWRVWVRSEPHDPAAESTWSVYDLSATLLAVVRTPPGFDLLQMGADFVVGRVRDGAVERLRVYGLQGAPALAGPDVMAAARAAEQPVSRPVTRGSDRMHETLRAAADLQQRQYETSGSYRYAHDADSLEMTERLPEDFRLHVLTAGPNGFTLLLFDTDEEVGCGLTVGTGGPTGWAPGRILCG